MVDPIASKVGSAGIQKSTVDGNLPAEKSGPSRFDQVKEQAASKAANAPGLPPPVESVSEAQRKQLIGEVRQRMEANPTSAPKEVYGPEMAQTTQQLGRLRHRVEGLAKSGTTESLKDRLNQIDKQFQSAGNLLDKIPSMTDPRSLLKLQVELYQVTQNIEMVSKAVEQVNSGVKQVLQTQL